MTSQGVHPGECVGKPHMPSSCTAHFSCPGHPSSVLSLHQGKERARGSAFMARAPLHSKCSFQADSQVRQQDVYLQHSPAHAHQAEGTAAAHYTERRNMAPAGLLNTVHGF